VLALTAISDRLKVFIQRLRNSYPDVQIEVEEHINNDILLTAIQAFHLFKVLQEAIINALKHSGCSQVTVSIQSHETWSIVIADDGSGFFPGKKSESGGNGLFNMKNRSIEGGWKIEWVKNETGGTSVVIVAE
jgi:signal transduction histidine kinase